MRKISFKLLAQLNPVSIETDAKTTKQLAEQITNHEELSKLIDVNYTVSNGVKSMNVLVDSKTMNEYYFDVDATLPEGDVLFFVTPVTSKFGMVSDDGKKVIVEQLEIVSRSINTIASIISNSCNCNHTSELEDKAHKEILELEKKANEVKEMLNKRFHLL